MDNSEMAKRVRAAAVAGWWTVIIAVIFMAASWVAFLAILHYKPYWILWLWGGGDMDWSRIQYVMLDFYATAKLMLLAVVVVVIWLSLWAGKLKRLG